MEVSIIFYINLKFSFKFSKCTQATALFGGQIFSWIDFNRCEQKKYLYCLIDNINIYFSKGKNKLFLIYFLQEQSTFFQTTIKL